MTTSDGARLARALLPHALLAFRTSAGSGSGSGSGTGTGTEDQRGPALAALDAFLADPLPSRFLAAARELGQLRRRTLIERDARGTLQRARSDGLSALREVPGVPATVVDRLEAGLPADLRSGPRLRALVDLARSYQELASRVVADTEEMRRRLRQAYPRRTGRKRPPS